MGLCVGVFFLFTLVIVHLLFRSEKLHFFFSSKKHILIPNTNCVFSFEKMF